MATNQDDYITRSALLATITLLANELAAAPAKFETMDELRELHNLLGEADSCAGNRTDYTLVRDSAFEEYAREMASDGGPIEGWPYDYIDWEKAAQALKQDYKQVDFDGVPYWVRA